MEEVHMKELRIYSYYLILFWILKFSFPNFYLKHPQITVKFWEIKKEWIEWTKMTIFKKAYRRTRLTFSKTPFLDLNMEQELPSWGSDRSDEVVIGVIGGSDRKSLQ